MTTTTSTTTRSNSGNGTNSGDAKKANAPSHEIFVVEGEGKDTKWTKVGVAFPTFSGNSHRVFIGKKGDPKQKVYLVCPSSQFDHADNSRPGEAARRIIYANIYLEERDTAGKPRGIDFEKRDGVAFLNRDDSLSLLIGDRGDPEQLKYQMRDAKRFKKQAQSAAAKG